MLRSKKSCEDTPWQALLAKMRARELHATGTMAGQSRRFGTRIPSHLSKMGDCTTFKFSGIRCDAVGLAGNRAVHRYRGVLR